jgi:hypothetical protein
MPVFVPGTPFDTDQPVISVDMSPDRPLTVGQHRFQLKVVDDAGNESEPADWMVLVIDQTRPTAVIDGPRQVNFGQGFELSARRSLDIGGRIVRYVWTLMD